MNAPAGRYRAATVTAGLEGVVAVAAGRDRAVMVPTGVAAVPVGEER